MHIYNDPTVLGSKIEFPTLLLKAFVSIYLSNESRSDNTSLNFVFRGHSEGKTDKELKTFDFPKDNTPKDLVGKSFAESSDEQKYLHSGYAESYAGFKAFCELILSRAIDQSNLDPEVIKLACNHLNYKPSAKSAKVYQHLFQIAAHAGLLEPRLYGYDYMRCIHNDYIQKLKKINPKQSLKPGIETEDTLHLAQIFKSQFERFDEAIIAVKSKAIAAGNCWQKIIITPPDGWHPSSGWWNGCSPKDTTQNYLQKKWRKIQSILKKNNMKISGFWTINFPLDGCPHMNFFIITKTSNRDRVIELFRNYFDHSTYAMDVQLDKDLRDDSINTYINLITNYLFPSIYRAKTSRELYHRSIGSIFNIRLYGFFGM